MLGQSACQWEGSSITGITKENNNHGKGSKKKSNSKKKATSNNHANRYPIRSVPLTHMNSFERD
jgi:hypothetical protein